MTKTSTQSLKISDKAAEMINKLRTQDWVKNKEHAKLRLVIQGGGCAGFEYTINVDDEITLEEDDIIFEKNGARVVIDAESLKHVAGSTVDYKEELICSSFVVTDNPNVEKGGQCSCGKSFSSKVT